MNKKKIITDSQTLANEYFGFISDSRKSLSEFTIKGYNDTMCLFFEFLEKDEKIPVGGINLS